MTYISLSGLQKSLCFGFDRETESSYEAITHMIEAISKFSLPSIMHSMN